MKKTLALVLISFSTITLGSTYQVTLNLGREDALLNSEVLKDQEVYEKELQDRRVLKKSYEAERNNATKRTFYIKANNQVEAHRMIASSPIFQNEGSTYKIKNVGNPILSTPKQNMSSKTYRVSLEWLEDDREKVQKLYGAQISALVNFHRKGIVEDAYMKSSSKFVDGKTLPKLSFTIKAPSKKEAQKLISKLPFAKYAVAKFKVRAIGGPTIAALNG